MKDVVTLRVRPYECDSYGHVNHAVYINYLEYARMCFLRTAGYDYDGLLQAGFATYISRVNVAYKSPAFSEDELTIESEPVEQRQVTGTMHQVIRREDTVIAEADVQWCIVNNRTGRPARPPEEFDLQRIR